MRAFWVLLVEDSQDHAELVRMALSSAKVPCHLSHVETGEEAIAWLRKAESYGRLPDLALLDVNLPLLSGHGLLRWIKSELGLRRMPVVMLTTSQSPSDITESYAAHANSYVVKPTSFPELKLILREVVHYWGALNAPVVKNDLQAETVSRPVAADIPLD